MRLLKEAGSQFRHRSLAPLHQVDRNEWVLELFHGPTRSSKDFAAQLQARLVPYFLRKRGRREHEGCECRAHHCGSPGQHDLFFLHMQRFNVGTLRR